MARYTVRFLASKSCYQMVPSSTNCRHYEKTTQVGSSFVTTGLEIQRILGYDLKQIFIGAEGTLGVVTGVSILAPVMPAATNAVVLALSSFDKVVPLYKTVKQDMGEIISAFEYMDRNAYNISVKHGQGKALSEEETEGAQNFVLIETSGGNKEHDEEVCPSLKPPPRLSDNRSSLEIVQPIRKGDGS